MADGQHLYADLVNAADNTKFEDKTAIAADLTSQVFDAPLNGNYIGIAINGPSQTAVANVRLQVSFDGGTSWVAHKEVKMDQTNATPDYSEVASVVAISASAAVVDEYLYWPLFAKGVGIQLRVVYDYGSGAGEIDKAVLFTF